MRYDQETYAVTAAVLLAIALMGVIGYILLRKSKTSNEYLAEVRRRRMTACVIFVTIFGCLALKNIIQFLFAK